MIHVLPGHKVPLPAPILSGRAGGFLKRISPRGSDLYLQTRCMAECAATVLAQVRAAASSDPEIRKEGARFRYWVSKEITRECGRGEAIFLWLYIEYRNDEWLIVDAKNELTRIEPGYGRRYEFLNAGRREQNV